MQIKSSFWENQLVFLEVLVEEVDDFYGSP